MAKIIQVHPDDSAEAVRRLLPQVRNERQVVLALPPGWTELDNMARMRLLQRQGQLLHIDIALATRHEATRKAAKQVGIPVYNRAEDAIARTWQMRPLSPLVDPNAPNAGLPEAPHWNQDKIIERVSRQRTRRARRRRIDAEERYRRPTPNWLRWAGYGFMGSLIVALLLLFTLYVLPAATVTLVPGQEPITVSVRIIADPTIDAPDYIENRLPARLIETNIEERGTSRTSGARQKATDKATGTVTFSNLGTTPVRIPSGTIVATRSGTPVNFRTTNSVELPGGVGQRVDAFIEAVEPGGQGNVLPNTITTVSGALRFRVRVTNRNGTFGGGSRLVSVVTQEDKDKLLQETKARAEAKAVQQLAEGLEPGEWLPPESVQTYVIAQTFVGFNDEEAEQVDLSLRMLVQGTTVEDNFSTQAALNALREAVPPRAQLVADTLLFQREPGAKAIGRSVEYTMTASAQYVIPIDPTDVRSLIAGLTPTAAIDALQRQWPLARSPEIYRDPEILPTLPTLGSRIQVRIEYDDE